VFRACARQVSGQAAVNLLHLVPRGVEGAQKFNNFRGARNLWRNQRPVVPARQVMRDDGLAKSSRPVTPGSREIGKCWRAILMVPRGRVELPTPAFSGPRSTGELPRHRYNTRFYGKAGILESKNRKNRARSWGGQRSPGPAVLLPSSSFRPVRQRRSSSR
jgi:hypothetical protein